jgi:hypothetical protein
MKEIEDGRPRSRAGYDDPDELSALHAIDRGVRYSLRAATYSDEAAATSALGEVIDAGYEAVLLSSMVEGELSYEIRVGPYDSLEGAQTAQALLRGSFAMDPSITVVAAETP